MGDEDGVRMGMGMGMGMRNMKRETMMVLLLRIPTMA
jgi:hypothetical protein